MFKPWKPKHCVVVGATGGLGAAFIQVLAADAEVRTIHALSRSGKWPVVDDRIISSPLDLQNAVSIAKAAETVSAHGPLDLVIVATGLRLSVRPAW